MPIPFLVSNNRNRIFFIPVKSYLLDLLNFSMAAFEPKRPTPLTIVGEDQEFQISCLEPLGLPPPKVYWRDPRGYIISDTGPVRVQDNTLIIASARMNEDDGNYTCVAENLAGETDISVQIVISSAFEFSREQIIVHDKTKIHIVFNKKNIFFINNIFYVYI